MLEKNDSLCYPLNKRDPEKTLFMLITPKLFKENPPSRLYGYKLSEYKNNPDSIKNNLPHRYCYWKEISKRIGWLTWDDFKDLNENCCPWIQEPRLDVN